MILGNFYIIFLFLFQQQIEINIINNTTFTIDDLNVYSQKFKSLKPKDTTIYKSFVFDELTNNSMINLKADNKQLILYIPPPKYAKYTIVLDSLNIKNRVIYYSILNK